jgi:hypothetical protein
MSLALLNHTMSQTRGAWIEVYRKEIGEVIIHSKKSESSYSGVQYFRGKREVI